MNRKSLLALVLSVMMMLTLLPASVFADEGGSAFQGKLKISGDLSSGSTLSADFSELIPEGMTAEQFSFEWYRMDLMDIDETAPEKYPEDKRTKIGTETYYTVTPEDVGYVIVLKLTGKPEMGMEGTVYAESDVVPYTEDAYTSEEAPDAETEETVYNEPYTESYEDTSAETTENYDYENPYEEPATEDYSYENPYEEPVTEDYTYNEVPSVDGGNEYSDSSAESSPYDETVPDSGSYGDPASAENSPYTDTEGGSENDPAQEESGTAESEPEDAPVYSLSADVTEVTFEDLEEGFDPAAVHREMVVITNTGNTPVTVKELEDPYFWAFDDVGNFLGDFTLAPGQSMNVLISVGSLAGVGEYSSQLQFNIAEDPNCNATVWSSVSVQAPEPSPTPEPTATPTPEPTATPTPEPKIELTEIVAPENIENLANGTPKTAEGLMLPLQVKIVTTAGEAYADVSWDVEGAEYDPTLKAAQSFVVYGVMTLPADVEDPSGLSQNPVMVNVTVDASLEPSPTPEPTATPTPEPTATPTPEPTATPTPKIELMQIVSPEDIKNLANGSPKTAEGLKLPSKVKILTTAGQYDADVKWDVEGTGYDPTLKVAQNFVVNGTVTLPAGVEDPSGLSKNPVKVNVNVAAEEKQPCILTAVTSPSAITGLANGTAKTEAALGLPSQIAIQTNQGNKWGKVTWDLASAKYDPKSTAAQNFTVNGKVILPSEVTNPNSVSTNVSVAVSVNAKPATAVEYVGLTDPAAVQNLENGSPKTAAGLGLPSFVTITTTQGTVQAPVTWDVNGCKYDPTAVKAQSFTVIGNVTLPNGVTNPKKLSTQTKIAVSVKGLNPKIADPANNKINGIDTVNGYLVGTAISFTAVGAGMDNTTPGRTDVRYVPLNWTVTNTYAWQNAPYDGAFKISIAGNYTLKVVYRREVYDGSNWVADGQQDAKSIQFRVYDANGNSGGGNGTATNDASNTSGTNSGSNQKQDVRTGDTTPVMMWILILAGAAVCIGAAAVIYFKKKK